MSDSPSSPPGRQPNPSSPPPNRNPHPHLDLSTLTFSPLTGASPSQTPTLHETYLSLKRNLSVKSLKELELREVSAALWRKGGKVGPEEEESELVIEQPEVEHETGEKEVVKRKSTGRLSHGRREPMPTDAEQLVVHALRGGVRSFLLASSLRAGVNLVVVALRITKKRGIPPSLVVQALFGKDTLRFGAMMGIFTFLYKSIFHALRLFPLPLLSTSSIPHSISTKQATKYWHPAVAGAISALAVLAEKKSRRVTIGQQLLVRGMQGNYNIAKRRGYINLPNGDILLFGLACGQIMAPEALPEGYRRWVTNASRVSAPCLPVNLSAYRSGTFDPETALESMTWKGGATPGNREKILEYVEKARGGDFGERFAPCEVVHPWVDSCSWTGVDRWQSVFRWMFPVYAALHVIPPILLRRKVFMANPQKVLLKSALGTLRSCSFLATFVTLFQGLVCTQRNLFYFLRARGAPLWLENLLLHKGYYWLSGFATCLSLFIEEKKRRGELAMYVLPRGLESLWSVLRRRSYVPFVPGGEIIMTSVGMAMVMSTYQNDPKSLSGLVRSVLYQFLGHH